MLTTKLRKQFFKSMIHEPSTTADLFLSKAYQKEGITITICCWTSTYWPM